jgi:hypothetical protein
LPGQKGGNRTRQRCKARASVLCHEPSETNAARQKPRQVANELWRTGRSTCQATWPTSEGVMPSSVSLPLPAFVTSLCAELPLRLRPSCFRSTARHWAWGMISYPLRESDGAHTFCSRRDLVESPAAECGAGGIANESFRRAKTAYLPPRPPARGRFFAPQKLLPLETFSGFSNFSDIRKGGFDGETPMTPAELFGTACLLSIAFMIASVWKNGDNGGLT